MATEWRDNDVWIVTINTARAWQLRLNWALGSIARAQVWRAEQVLAKAPRDALKIIVTHHPLIWPQEAASTEARMAATARRASLWMLGPTFSSPATCT